MRVHPRLLTVSSRVPRAARGPAAVCLHSVSGRPGGATPSWPQVGSAPERGHNRVELPSWNSGVVRTLLLFAARRRFGSE